MQREKAQLNGHAGNRKLTNVEGALTAWMRDEGAV
jgi:hypothetical protein